MGNFPLAIIELWMRENGIFLVPVKFLPNPGLMDCPCLPPPAQRKARAGQL